MGLKSPRRSDDEGRIQSGANAEGAALSANLKGLVALRKSEMRAAANRPDPAARIAFLSRSPQSAPNPRLRAERCLPKARNGKARRVRRVRFAQRRGSSVTRAQKVFSKAKSLWRVIPTRAGSPYSPTPPPSSSNAAASCRIPPMLALDPERISSSTFNPANSCGTARARHRRRQRQLNRIGCAKAFRTARAELAISWLNEKARRHVEPLARELVASIVGELDVAVPGTAWAPKSTLSAGRQPGGALGVRLIEPLHAASG